MSTVEKSQEQAVQEMVDTYAALVSGNPADVGAGTTNRDILDTVAQQVSTVFSALETVRLLTSLKNAEVAATDGLSPLGLNFDVYQYAATKSSGTVYFQRILPPTKIVDFPVGTLIMTTPDVAGDSVKFLTTTAAQLSPSTVINPTNRRYEASAPIVAILAGDDGNVGTGSITTLDPVNRNIDVITNKDATSGGTNYEDNTAYAARIRTKTVGTSLGTQQGYIDALQTEFPAAITVALAGPGNSDMRRSEFGNEIDVYVIGQTSEARVDTVSASGLSYDYLNTHPVDVVSSVVGTTTGSSYVLGNDVRFDKDTSIVYGGSVKAFDKLTWLSANRPWAGQQLSVALTRNKLISDAQDYFDSDDIRFVTADILVKEAKRIGIILAAQATAFSGYDRTTLATNIQTSLSDGLSQYTLGQTVRQSDIVALIGNVAGIDKVGIPLTELRESTETGGTVTDPILIGTSEYARLDSATITVV